MTLREKLRAKLRGFRKADDGVVTISFVIVFPVFMFFFLMTFESGIVNLRQVMLERGVDLAVRDIRIGTIQGTNNDRLDEDIRKRVCEVAGVIPNCESQLRLEMIRRDVRNWVPINSAVRCVDRSNPDEPALQFDEYGNNELMYLRACVRADPFLPTTGIGLRLAEDGANAAAAGSYVFVSSAAFVIEPFRAENN
ncbi:MAG: TadE/TadG family type IV pilus assembly protein [Pseudomonadota bacterium]